MDDYVRYGFFLPKNEKSNTYPAAQCLFCSVTYANSNLVPSKLSLHLKKQHSEYQYKSEKFFQSKVAAYSKQVISFKSQMSEQDSEKLSLASFQMAHVLLKTKRPYTELETVVLPCLKIAADVIHGGENSVAKVAQIPLFDTTISRRSLSIGEDLENQLILKLKKAPSFAIQLDETTDIGSEAQLLVCCRFADVELNKIAEHYLFCQPLGVDATSKAIFQTLDDYFTKHQLSWENYKSVTTDGAAAMQGRVNGVVEKIKKVSPDCISIHCVIHREVLVAKKLKGMVNNDASAVFENFLSDIVNVVNYVRGHAKKHKIFMKFCEKMEASNKRLLFHSETRWLSRGRVLSRVFELRKELGIFFLEEKDQRAAKFFDNFWLAKLTYMACIFEHLNKLNISLQGKDSDIFKSTGKVNALKMKLPLWKKRVESNNFSDFPILNNFIEEYQGFEGSLMVELRELILAHLDLLQENFDSYFPKEQTSYLEANSWIFNHLSMHRQKMKSCLIFEQIYAIKLHLKKQHILTFGLNCGMYLNIESCLKEQFVY